MKRNLFSFCAAAIAVSLAACSNSGTTSGTGDSSSSAGTTTATTPATTAPATTPPTTATSVVDYAAMADSVEKNSQQGYYLNPKTGKPYKSLKVDRTTGKVSDNAGEPVWRYVDNRNWWVYGGDKWSQVGEAKMQGDKLMYKGDGDSWTDYDNRWKTDDEEMIKKWKLSDDGMKEKIKTEDGDKIKIKTDADGNTKIKVNGEKTKIDKDGNIKKQ